MSTADEDRLKYVKAKVDEATDDWNRRTAKILAEFSPVLAASWATVKQDPLLAQGVLDLFLEEYPISEQVRKEILAERAALFKK